MKLDEANHPRIYNAGREKPLPRLVEELRHCCARVSRFEGGNLGDHKTVGGGVSEARLNFGPGYRLYFGKDGVAVILLLVGGDKSSQSKDIAAAKRYWNDFREAKHGVTAS